MNKHERNKLEMLGVVWKFGESVKESFTGVPAIINGFADIEMIHKEIGLNDNVVKEGTKGKVISKDISQDEIISTGLVFAGAIYGYAADKNDAELITFADINSKTFLKQRDSEIPLFVEKILDKAVELGNGLIPYGITEEKRTAAKEKLDDYLEKFGSVSIGKGTKKSAKETIVNLLDKADKKIKVLDKLMISFKESNPELYSKYTAARVIYDKGGSHKADEPETPKPDEPETPKPDEPQK
ncbi:MAG: hypothetical protein NTX22_14480 [Ignavibacteriales bacterium]|nr:hypothetical protein [Ignavibacteriales bacterium]